MILNQTLSYKLTLWHVRYTAKKKGLNVLFGFCTPDAGTMISAQGWLQGIGRSAIDNLGMDREGLKY